MKKMFTLGFVCLAVLICFVSVIYLRDPSGNVIENRKDAKVVKQVSEEKLYEYEPPTKVASVVDKNGVDKKTAVVETEVYARDEAAQEMRETKASASVTVPVAVSEEPESVTVVEKSDSSAEDPSTESEIVNVESEVTIVESESSNIISHGVSVSHAKIYRPYTDQFSETMSLIASDTVQFDTSHIQSLAEIDYILLDSIGISKPTSETLGGPITGVRIVDEYISTTKSAVEDFEAAQARYRSYIKNALYGMNLNCTDKEMVDQINAHIVRNFSYSMTNDKLMSSFTDNKIGQCMHYARLFSDMCKAVGISCSYIEGYADGEYHAFNSVTIDGQKYYFDVCWNDEGGSQNAYSWLSEAQLRKTHSW